LGSIRINNGATLENHGVIIVGSEPSQLSNLFSRANKIVSSPFSNKLNKAKSAKFNTTIFTAIFSNIGTFFSTVGSGLTVTSTAAFSNDGQATLSGVTVNRGTLTNSATLAVAGNFSNTGSISNTATLAVAGTFSNTGSISNTGGSISVSQNGSISNQGTIAGGAVSGTVSGNTPVNDPTPPPSNFGLVVGIVESGDGVTPKIWLSDLATEPISLPIFPGNHLTFATSKSSTGKIVGCSSNSDLNGIRGIVWNNRSSTPTSLVISN
jgi:hypothetical protein